MLKLISEGAPIDIPIFEWTLFQSEEDLPFLQITTINQPFKRHSIIQVFDDEQFLIEGIAELEIKDQFYADIIIRPSINVKDFLRLTNKVELCFGDLDDPTCRLEGSLEIFHFNRLKGQIERSHLCYGKETLSVCENQLFSYHVKHQSKFTLHIRVKAKWHIKDLVIIDLWETLRTKLRDSKLMTMTGEHLKKTWPVTLNPRTGYQVIECTLVDEGFITVPYMASPGALSLIPSLVESTIESMALDSDFSYAQSSQTNPESLSAPLPESLKVHIKVTSFKGSFKILAMDERHFEEMLDFDIGEGAQSKTIELEIPSLENYRKTAFFKHHPEWIDKAYEVAKHRYVAQDKSKIWVLELPYDRALNCHLDMSISFQTKMHGVIRGKLIAYKIEETVDGKTIQLQFIEREVDDDVMQTPGLMMQESLDEEEPKAVAQSGFCMQRPKFDFGADEDCHETPWIEALEIRNTFEEQMACLSENLEVPPTTLFVKLKDLSRKKVVRRYGAPTK